MAGGCGRAGAPKAESAAGVSSAGGGGPPGFLRLLLDPVRLHPATSRDARAGLPAPEQDLDWKAAGELQILQPCLCPRQRVCAGTGHGASIPRGLRKTGL